MQAGRTTHPFILRVVVGCASLEQQSSPALLVRGVLMAAAEGKTSLRGPGTHSSDISFLGSRLGSRRPALLLCLEGLNKGGGGYLGATSFSRGPGFSSRAARQ
jgi:hypothetical protein